MDARQQGQDWLRCTVLPFLQPEMWRRFQDNVLEARPSAKTFQTGLSGAGISGGNSMALGNTSNFGSGSFSVWSAGTAAITYSTGYTACTSGTGTYALRLAVR